MRVNHAGELAGVVDAHERGARTALGIGQWLNGLVLMGDGSAGACRRENRTQSAVKSCDGRVERTVWPHRLARYYKGKRGTPRLAATVGTRGTRAFAMAHLLEYTSPPFLARPPEIPTGAGTRHE